ncbi:GH25 family lysozyme [Streptomyces sp. NPDC002845]
MTVKGVDVASYQATDFSTKGLDFAFVKITEGTSYTNPKWVAQRGTARDAGLVTGFYHFVRPGSMTAQADYFLSKINLRAGDILALDWEDPGVSCAEKDAWLKYVKRKAPGHRVILYCNVDYWTTRDTTSYAGDGLWIAQYNGKPGRPSIKAEWKFHQYTSTPIDTNLGNFANAAALRAWAGASGSSTGSGAGTSGDSPLPSGSRTYTIRSGDTLSGIAARQGVTLHALLDANPSFKAHPNTIYPGQKLKIPAGAGSGSSGEKTVTYTVRTGDTLSEIAVKYRTTVARLVKANDIKDPGKIYPGDKIKIVK